MVNGYALSTNTDLAQGLQKLIKEFEKRTGLNTTIRMTIAGGMAVHLYTAARVTTDVDAEFSKRILLPGDLIVETGSGQALFLDTNYNSSFALMHENYLEDAVPVAIGTDLVSVYVLSPLDLIISKIARLSGPDATDIESLIAHFDISASEIEQRAEEALKAYVGNATYLRINLRDVLQFALRHADEQPPAPSAPR